MYSGSEDFPPPTHGPFVCRLRSYRVSAEPFGKGHRHEAGSNGSEDVAATVAVASMAGCRCGWLVWVGLCVVYMYTCTRPDVEIQELHVVTTVRFHLLVLILCLVNMNTWP